MENPFFSLCMIVKNEEKVLERCLDSVKEYIHDIIIVDTGSEDLTKKIAAKHTPKIYDYKWNNNFSEARNFAASKAAGKWILVLDADEYVDPNNLKKAIVDIRKNENLYDIYAVNIINFAGQSGEKIAQHRHARIYLNDGSIEFFRSIHEQLRKKDSTNVKIGLSKLMVYHSGYLSKTITEKEKNNRNLTLIKNELKTNSRAFDFFNLGNELRLLGKTQEALDAYIQAFQKKEGFWVEWIPFLLCNMVECLIILERYTDALAVINDASNIFEDTADFIYLKGLVYLSQKRYDDAKYVFLNIISNSKRYQNVIKSPDYRDYLPYKSLGYIYELEKDYKNAVLYFIKALNNNKYCLESAVRVLKILSKFHSEKEIYKIFSKNILSDNGEFNKKLLIYALNQGLTVFSNLLNTNYKTIEDKHILQLKINIISGNYEVYNKDKIEPITLLKGLNNLIINFADLVILYLSIEDISNKRRLQVIINQSNLSSLISVLNNEDSDVGTIDAEGYLYLLEKCIIYKKFDLLKRLLEFSDGIKVDINGRIASIFYNRGFEDESIEFYEKADENTLKEQDFCQIIDWLISKGNLQAAYDISKNANNRFSEDFRFYKYLIQLNIKLGINDSEFIKMINEKWKISQN